MILSWIQKLYLHHKVCTCRNIVLTIVFIVSIYCSQIFQINIGMLSKFSVLSLTGSMAFLALVMNFKSRKIYTLLYYLQANFKSTVNRREERKLAAMVVILLLANVVACVLDFDVSAYATATNVMTFLCTAQVSSDINVCSCSA